MAKGFWCLVVFAIMSAGAFAEDVQKPEAPLAPREDTTLESTAYESEAGMAEPFEVSSLAFEATRADIGRERYQPLLEANTFEVRMPPSTRFYAHRGAGARIATFRETLAPPPPIGVRQRGPWRLVTSLTLSSRYSGNVFLTDQDPKSDLTVVIGPMVGLEWSHTDFAAALRYSPTVYQTLAYSENSRIEHQVGLEASWRIRDSLIARFEHIYGRRSVVSSTEGVDANRYIDQETTVGMTYKPWEEWELGVAYLRYDATFDARASKVDDVTTNGVEVRALRRVAPALWALATLGYTDVDNKNDVTFTTDNQVMEGTVGLQFRPKQPDFPLTGTVKVGYATKEFESSQIPDSDGIIFSAGLSYAFREWMTFYLTGSRSIFDTTLTSTTAPSGFSFFRTSAALGTRLDLGENWGCGAQVFWGNDDYNTPGPQREDDLSGGNVSFYYKPFDWGQLVAVYQYQTNDSNVDANDFSESSLILGAELSLSYSKDVLGGSR